MLARSRAGGPDRGLQGSALPPGEPRGFRGGTGHGSSVVWRVESAFGSTPGEPPVAHVLEEVARAGTLTGAYLAFDCSRRTRLTRRFSSFTNDGAHSLPAKRLSILVITSAARITEPADSESRSAIAAMLARSVSERGLLQVGKASRMALRASDRRASQGSVSRAFNSAPSTERRRSKTVGQRTIAVALIESDSSVAWSVATAGGSPGVFTSVIEDVEPPLSEVSPLTGRSSG